MTVAAMNRDGKRDLEGDILTPWPCGNEPRSRTATTSDIVPVAAIDCSASGVGHNRIGLPVESLSVSIGPIRIELVFIEFGVFRCESSSDALRGYDLIFHRVLKETNIRRLLTESVPSS
jgi:hypothetical protein